jgi:hypothetical protein
MADAIHSFRNTSGFVTDATGTYVLNTEAYPTTRDGYTFGWSAGIDGTDRSGADRDAAVTDKRLAGINYAAVSGTQCKFRVDLPAAGDYTVRLAIGDTGFDQSGQRQVFTVYDNVTSKLVIDKATGPAQDHYYDATGVDRTEAAWPASNLPSAAITFASTIFNLFVGDPATSGTCVLAHMQIASSGSAVVRGGIKNFPKFFMRQPLTQGRLL